MRQCGYCGRENAELGAHCIECGTALEPDHEIESQPCRPSRNDTLALSLRVALGIVAGLQLVLFAVLHVLGQFLDALFHGGFQIGPPPPRLYSPAWVECLFLSSVILCVYHLLVAVGVWGRWSWRIGLLLHLGFVICLVLCLCFTRIDVWVYFPLLVGPAIWGVYARRFRPFELGPEKPD